MLVCLHDVARDVFELGPAASGRSSDRAAPSRAQLARAAVPARIGPARLHSDAPDCAQLPAASSACTVRNMAMHGVQGKGDEAKENEAGELAVKPTSHPISAAPSPDGVTPLSPKRGSGNAAAAAATGAVAFASSPLAVVNDVATDADAAGAGDEAGSAGEVAGHEESPTAAIAANAAAAAAAGSVTDAAALVGDGAGASTGASVDAAAVAVGDGAAAADGGDAGKLASDGVDTAAADAGSADGGGGGNAQGVAGDDAGAVVSDVAAAPAPGGGGGGGGALGDADGADAGALATGATAAAAGDASGGAAEQEQVPPQVAAQAEGADDSDDEAFDAIDAQSGGAPPFQPAHRACVPVRLRLAAMCVSMCVLPSRRVSGLGGTGVRNRAYTRVADWCPER